MKSTANHLREILNQVLIPLRNISDEAASLKSRPGKWSKKEILGHLIDSACNNHQKFVRTMEQPHLEFVGYAQNHWVSAQNYQQTDWLALIAFWEMYNLHVAHVIDNVSETVLQNTIMIEGVGPFTLEFIMKDYAEHLKHHLHQIVPEIGLKSVFENVYGA
jgi:hypothetical protein